MKKYLIIDFDSTFIKTETLDELSKICSHDGDRTIVKKIKHITNQAMLGKINFSDALNSRLNLINIDSSKITEIIEILKNDISKSIIKNKQFFIDNYNYIYIVSGGFKDIIKNIVNNYNIPQKHIIANSFLFKNNLVVGVDPENDLLKEQGKVIAVNKLKLNGKIIMVGDGYTDYEVKKYKAADIFIAYTENINRKSIIETADIVANNFDKVIEEFMR
tara:strand:+ start:1160 stop:1813 length:654 start_codon:yes stop_codon:yes gene_type:complete